MNVLDIALVVVALTAAVAGYRSGFVTGIFSLVGLLAGAFAAILVVPFVFSGDVTVLTATLALVFVSLAAFAVQGVTRHAGTRLRAKIVKPEARVTDAVGGALLSGWSVLVAASVVGAILVGARIEPVAPMVQTSAVLSGVTQARGGVVNGTLDALTTGTFVPRYVAPFAPEQVKNVAAPDSEILTGEAVLDAHRHVVLVNATSTCKNAAAGTGFYYAAGRVMTNAHVVAGSNEVTVTANGVTTPATVVEFDAELDLAVLAVEDAPTSDHLSFATGTTSGQDAVVLGYPGGEKFDVQAARVREEKALRSPNSAGKATVIRDVVSLRGLVRPGNSGGPVINTDGDVIGVVFAASLTHEETAYALSVDEVAGVAAAGKTTTVRASVGTCR